MGLSRRALAVSESETLRIAAEMAAMRRKGADVVSLLEGEPELPSERIETLLYAKNSLWIGFCGGGGISRITNERIENFAITPEFLCVRALFEEHADFASVLGAEEESGLIERVLGVGRGAGIQE